ncbi:hypothetical protein [Asaia bogorensis]|uniref:hypothetical protein n=1 Tax=Asaia bogorensis TaxID=91915 RepID=UPI0013CF347F|nr:hypothetical protein [Asaia bogorensis]
MAPSFSHAETADRLSRALGAEPSATKVLQAYCGHLMPGVAITAIALPTHAQLPPAPFKTHFSLGAHEHVRLRHVSLRCGTHVLSDAWNWYVPERLEPAMNRLLDTTTLPFGHVVGALHFHRVALESERNNLPPDILLRNTAMLTRGADGLPFSLVVENYLASGFAGVASGSDQPPP